MRLSRRPWFFLGIGIIFLVMMIPTPEEFWWLNMVMGAIALVWAVLLAMEEYLAERTASRQDDVTTDPLEGDGP